MLDPQIPLSVKPIEVASPAQSIGHFMQLRGELSRIALQQAQIQQAQAQTTDIKAKADQLNRDLADQKAFQYRLAANAGDWGATFNQLEKTGEIAPVNLQKFQNSHAETIKNTALGNKEEIEAHNTQLRTLGAGIGAILQLPAEQRAAEYAGWLSRVKADPQLAKGAAGLPEAWSDDQAKALQWQGTASQQINEAALKQKADERAAIAATQAATAAADTHNEKAAQLPGDIAKSEVSQADAVVKKLQAAAMQSMTPEKWGAQVDAAVPPTGNTAALNSRTKALVQSAVSMGLPLTAIQAVIKDASDQIGRTETAVRSAQATAPIKINVAAANAQAGATAAGLTEDDFRRAGEQYAMTGVMPPMGRGAFERGKIMHYGQQFARESGMSPQDLAVAQAAFAGDRKSLENFQKQRDQIVSFEQTAQKNLDLFLDAASKIPDTGVPWLNQPLRTLDAKLIGSDNMAAVNAARQIANNEIAKVTSGGGLGGVLSDSARHEVSSFNPADATFKQTVAVAKMLKADMANRHQSMDATLGEIKARMGGGSPEPMAATAPLQQLPSGAGKAIDKATAEQFYKAAGGDPAKAREMAKQKGWAVQ